MKMDERQDGRCEYGKTICLKSLSGKEDGSILCISMVEAQVRNPLFFVIEHRY